MFFKKKPTALDLEVDRLVDLLSEMDCLDKDYYRLTAYLERLQEIQIKANKPRLEIDANTMLTVGANLLGILFILQHENLHAVSSKAIGFVLKLKP